MKKIAALINMLATAIVVLMATGCTDDMDRIGSLAPTDVLRFTASLGSDSLRTSSRGVSGHMGIEEEEWQLSVKNNSRASLTTFLTGNAGVIGYSEGAVLSTLNNVEFTFDGNELSSANPVYWKDMSSLDNIQFYAYAPYSLGLSGKSFTYTIPDVNNQVDIIVAESDLIAKANFRQTVPLVFRHALTAIRFKVGFECSKVNSITVSGVHNRGNYTIGGEWSGQSGSASYTTNIGENDILMLMPQTLPEDAKVTLVYDDDKTISVELKNKVWEPGKLITYTLHQGTPPSYIYFDLAAGKVNINASNYSGYVFKEGESSAYPIKGTHSENNHYYVYQSTKNNQTTTGLRSNGSYVLPQYDPVKYKGQLWSDYITNNTCVEDVIHAWDNKEGTSGAVRDSQREGTSNWIYVKGKLNCKLTIDNLYSTHQTTGFTRIESGITFIPNEDEPSQLTINIIGDNRFGNIMYQTPKKTGSKLIFEGKGSLTVADVDYKTGTLVSGTIDGYYSNHYCSAIGSNNATSPAENSYGIIINGGVIFAGSTAAENCTAIGAGGNGTGEVIINGGIVTAVATTTGATIGGGIGYESAGGKGYVTITGGNVYAYNFANEYDIPSSAIGGAGSRYARGQEGTVIITGGNVYAESGLGTAIGGGSSSSTTGGDAIVEISGGMIVAKSLLSAGIGGGTGGTGYNKSGSKVNADGGTATIKISNSPIIRTGSIGGGKTNDNESHIGSADIEITGGDIQAQFVMAAGAKISPQFEMTGGLIRNSHTEDSDYFHIVENGGAVYIEDGTCMIKNGTIRNCTATNGGAIYVKGGTVTLSGGTICDNLAYGGHGGGIYIKEGSFYMPEAGSASVIANSAILRNGKGGNGGGLYVTSDASAVTVDILSGSIKENTSDRKGGGVCVDMSGTTQTANVTVGKSDETGPDISANHTLLSGGGLYVSGLNADITINGGKINGNSTSAYVPNENVANEGGLVTLNAGDVTHNVVTFYSNGGQGVPETRKIVTATNGLLNNAPEYSRPGYEFVNWNTRADGNGDTYSNGQTINISANMELYARWKLK